MRAPDDHEAQDQGGRRNPVATQAAAQNRADGTAGEILDCYAEPESGDAAQQAERERDVERLTIEGDKDLGGQRQPSERSDDLAPTRQARDRRRREQEVRDEFGADAPTR